MDAREKELFETEATDAITTSAEEIREECEETDEEFEQRNPCNDCGNADDCPGACDAKRDYVDEAKRRDMADASDSIPEAQETFSVDLPMSEIFSHPLPVHLTDVELGCYSKQQAELWTQWGRLNQQKKDSAKAYGDQIKRVEDQLDEITRIVEEGSEERPVECRWMFDYHHGVKKLIRLDKNIVVDEKTLSKEELDQYRQPNLLEQTENSVAAVEECFRQGDAPTETEKPADGEIYPAEGATASDGSTTVEENTGENAAESVEVVNSFLGLPVVIFDPSRECCKVSDREWVEHGVYRLLCCQSCGCVSRVMDHSDPENVKKVVHPEGLRYVAEVSA